jgi:hypothetical protein
VYNKLPNGADEYLGTAEVSVATILSNAGQIVTQWVKLVRDKEEAGQVRRAETDMLVNLEAATSSSSAFFS